MTYPAEHNIYASSPRKTYFEVDTAVVKESMTFGQIAAALDISVEEIAYFNPQYRKSEIPAGGNCLTLPKAKIGTFLSNETEIYAAIKSQQLVASESSMAVKEVQKTHTVRNGEKLSTIARKYGVTVADLKSWNYIGKKGVRTGKKLIVYVKQDVAVPTPTSTKLDTPKDPQINVAVKTSEETTTKLADNSSASDAKVHKVKKGETLYGISKKYGISVDKLIEINGLKKNPQLLLGQKLKLVS
jgi:membrane-bound lytic murein transglycosylase D